MSPDVGHLMDPLAAGEPMLASVAGNNASEPQVQYLPNPHGVQLNLEAAAAEPPGMNFTALIVLQPSTTILVPIVMFSVGLIGNIVAVGVYHCSASWHRDTAFYGILRGFFITSIIGYLAVYPLMIAVHVNGLHWIGGGRMCDFHGFAVLTFGMSLAYITGVLGFERFLAACRPLTYNRKVEPRKIPFVLVLLWLVSVFTGILPLVGFGRITLQYPSTWCFIDWRNEETVGRLFSSVLATIVVAVILLVIVSIIAATVGASCRTAKKCRGTVAGKDNERGRYSLTLTIDDNSHRIPRRFFAADRALMWATFHYSVLACGFLVCYIPVVMRIIANVSGKPLNNFKNMSAMHWAEFYPAFCPWLYILCHEQIWMRLTCREPAYRDVPYTRQSVRRRNSSRRSSRQSSTRGHDGTREAGSVRRQRELSSTTSGSSTSNHVNVIMHDHVDGYAVGNRRESASTDEEEPLRGRSAKKKLDFIKEDDSNRGRVPHSPSAASSTSPTRSTSPSTKPSATVSPQSHKPPTTASSPQANATTTTITTTTTTTPTKEPLVVTTIAKSKLVVTNSLPTSNGPIVQNHVNASRSKSSSGASPTKGDEIMKKGDYTQIPTSETEDSVPLVEAMERRSAFAQAGRKESSI